MENENNNLKINEYISTQELLITRKSIYKAQLDKIKNEIVVFCQSMNMFQNKENFFNLTMKEQFDFNECIEEASNKIKKDFEEMEQFYVKCKNNCLKINNSDEIQDKINQHIESKTSMLRPNLPPCINQCVGMFHYITQKYSEYMTTQKGIYFELVDYKSQMGNTKL